MSLELSNKSKPKKLYVNSYSIGPESGVLIGDYDISLSDFLLVAQYVLICTELRKGDPRLQFLETVKSMKKVKGLKPGETRLLPVPKSKKK